MASPYTNNHKHGKISMYVYRLFRPHHFHFSQSSACGVVLFISPGGWINIQMLSYQYRKSRCGDKTILRPSYLHNGISYTGKMTSLYWIRAQGLHSTSMPDKHITIFMIACRLIVTSMMGVDVKTKWSYMSCQFWWKEWQLVHTQHTLFLRRSFCCWKKKMWYMVVARSVVTWMPLVTYFIHEMFYRHS